MLSLNVVISFQGCDGIELLDWLFDQNDGILRHEEAGHHGNHHTWPIQDSNVRAARAAVCFVSSTLQFLLDMLCGPLSVPSLSAMSVCTDGLMIALRVCHPADAAAGRTGRQ